MALHFYDNTRGQATHSEFTLAHPHAPTYPNQMTDTSPKIFDRWRIADAEATAAELALNDKVIAALDGGGASIFDDGRNTEARTLRQIADALFALAMEQLEAARSK